MFSVFSSIFNSFNNSVLPFHEEIIYNSMNSMVFYYPKNNIYIQSDNEYGEIFTMLAHNKKLY